MLRRQASIGINKHVTYNPEKTKVTAKRFTEMDIWNSIVLLLLLWISTQFILSIIKYKLGFTRLPPGPFPLPITGNLTKLGSNPHQSLSELAKTYGPVMTLQLGYQTTVVVSSVSVARDVLLKHDVSFSNRNVSHAHGVHGHDESSVVLLPPSTKWRNLRKICTTQVFSNSRLDASRDLRREKVQQLLSYIQACSQNGTAVNIGQAAFSASLNFLSNTIFSMDLADPSSETAREFKENVWAMLVEAGKPNLSDFFPVLKALDPQGIRRRLHNNIQKMFNVFNGLIDERLRTREKTGVVQDNDVLDALLSISKDNTEFQPSDVPHLLLDLFVAGSDTTSSTLEWAMSELLRNPDKLKKAQDELDEVIGKGNPIEETDMPRLPYLQAVVKETLRLHPAVPFLVPRKVHTDVELSGFVVPKNAQVLVNVWSMGRDSRIWENAHSFEPERFLGSPLEFKGRDFEFIPFGAGRRICPGLPLANRILHWVLGSLIHSFNWKLEDGVAPEDINMEEKFGFTLAKAQPLRAIPIRV